MCFKPASTALDCRRGRGVSSVGDFVHCNRICLIGQFPQPADFGDEDYDSSRLLRLVAAWVFIVCNANQRHVVIKLFVRQWHLFFLSAALRWVCLTGQRPLLSGRCPDSLQEFDRFVFIDAKQRRCSGHSIPKSLFIVRSVTEFPEYVLANLP